MKKALTEHAITVDAAHHALTNARKNYESKRELFRRATVTLQTCESVFSQVKRVHDQKLIETV